MRPWNIPLIAILLLVFSQTARSAEPLPLPKALRAVDRPTVQQAEPAPEPAPAEQPPEAAPDEEQSPPPEEGGAWDWFKNLLGGSDEPRQPGPFERSHATVHAAFRSIVQKGAESTVEVYCNEKQRALGTVVAPDGWILTKASELKPKDKIICRDKNQRELEAKLVGVESRFDLALLKVEATDLVPIAWHEGDEPAPGSWVVTPAIDDIPRGVGIIGAATRSLFQAKAVLGVLLEQNDKGPRIEQLVPGSGAANAGLQKDDIIVEVDGTKVATRDELVNLIGNYKPGDKVKLKYLRGEEQLEAEATLGTRPSLPIGIRNDIQNRMGSRLSNHRDGFPAALQHDTVLLPTECGGPLLDLDGRAVGINIARAGRVETYAIPAAAVLPLIDELKSGRLAPDAVSIERQEEVEKLRGELASLVESHQKSAETLQQAEGRLAEKQKELEEAQKRQQEAAEKLKQAQEAVKQAETQQAEAAEQVKQKEEARQTAEVELEVLKTDSQKVIEQMQNLQKRIEEMEKE